MPNWCFAGVRVSGPKEKVRKLFNMMKNLEEMEEPLVENGFGSSWYGNLVTILGGDWNEIYCRGSWSDLRLIEDDVLAWNDETAWSPMAEVFELIEKAIPGLKVWYIAEEEGMEIYITNDRECRYFPDRYILQTPEDREYYESLDQLLSDAAKELKFVINTKEELEDTIQDLEDWAFYEFEVVD